MMTSIQRLAVTTGAVALVFGLSGGVEGPATAGAQVPQLVGFQGYLTDLGGTPVAAPEGMEFGFHLYHEAAAGEPFWSDTYEAVPVENGVFWVLLGASNNPLPAIHFDGPVKYLGIVVNGSELQPRLQIVAVPYAMAANTADVATFADSAGTLGGLSADDFVKQGDIPDVSQQVAELEGQIAGLQGQIEQLNLLLTNPDCANECNPGQTGCSDDEGSGWTCGEAGDDDDCTERIFTACSGLEKCVTDQCACAPSWTNVCIGDDAFEQDSCGKPGKLIAKCGEGLCNDGSCVNWQRETPLQLGGMNDLITIGGSFYGVGNNGVVVHYDGTSWTHMATDTQKNLHAIWGYEKAGDTVLYAVGENGKVLKFEAGKWSTVITGVYSNLNDIFGLSSTNIMVVGDNGTVLRFDGNAWQSETWDAETSWKNETFRAVWAHSASQIWVGGDNGTIIHNDGSPEWTLQGAPNTNRVRALWGVSDQNVWAACDGQILHFTASWEIETTTTVDLHALWGVPTTPLSILAVGDGGTVIKRDSVSWTEQNPVKEGLGSGANLRGVSGGGAPGGGTWILAANGSVARQDDTGKWTFPAITRTVRGFYGLPGQADIHAVGSDCLARRYNGGEWLPATIDAGACAGGTGSSDFLAIDGNGVSVIAVGEDGLLKTWDGSTWLDMPGPNSNHNRDVWVASADGVVLVQDSATWVWNGVLWQNSGGGGGVGGDGTSVNDFYVVDGSTGKVHHFDGSEWSATTVAGGALKTIHLVSATEVLVAGTNGAVHQFDGNEWTNISIPDDVLGGDGTVNSVWTMNPLPVFAAGNAGFTYVRDGTSWSMERTFPNKDHWVVYGTDGANVLLGGNGTIFRRN